MLFSGQDAHSFPAGEQLEPATANAWVQWARPRVQGAKDVVDLEVEQLPWRQWLRQREDCAFVVGVGLVACEIRKVFIALGHTHLVRE